MASRRHGQDYYGMQMRDRRAGSNAVVIVDGVVRFDLMGGKLSDWSMTHRGDAWSGMGDYHVKYSTFDDKLEWVGPYKIEYDFPTDRVKKIGSHVVEYDFFTGKIARIGSTRITYGPFGGEVSEIKGRTPGLIIYLF